MVQDCKKRVERISEQIRQLSGQTQLNTLSMSLQSLRGVSQIVSVVVVSELGDLTRFESPSKLMAYLGLVSSQHNLVSSQHNSGDKKRPGKITKTGNGHVRRALVEAAQAYRLPARKSRAIAKRNESLPQEICKIAWQAQVSLCGRYKRLVFRGKNSNLVKIAIARELAGFMWAIAHAIPKLHKIKESLRSSIVGFIRHEQESLNNTQRSRRLCQLLREHYLMLPASDYPLVSCSPAELTSGLSDTYY